jgi:hypothetical protein
MLRYVLFASVERRNVMREIGSMQSPAVLSDLMHFE